MVFADKMSLRSVLVMTVASALVVSGCSKDDESRKFSKINPSALHAPVNNPAIQNGQVVMPDGARTPEGNAGMGTGSDYAMKANSAPQVVPGAVAGQPAKQESRGGMFDWMRKDGGNAAASTAQAPQQRKVPRLNHEGVTSDAMLAPSTFQAAAAEHVDVNTVTETDTQVFAASQPSIAPDAAEKAAVVPQPVVTETVVVAQQEEFVPVEPSEIASAPAPKEYPALSTVPPRPERLDEAEKSRDQKFAELEHEYNASTAQRADLDAQVAADAEPVAEEIVVAQATQGEPTSMSQDGYAGIQGYGDEVKISGHGSTAPDHVETFASEGEVVTAQNTAVAEPAAGQPYQWQSAAARNAAAPEEASEGSPMVASAEQVAAPVTSAPVNAAPVTAAPVTYEPAVQTPVASDAPLAEEIPVVVEEREMAVVETPSAPAPMAAAEPVVAHAEPAPVSALEVAPQAAPAENEWVEIQQPSAAEQAAAPVENMDVAIVPESENVVLSPEAAAIALTPPSDMGATRQLPESRYAARRQAIYAQQYARRAAVDRAN